MKGQSMFGMMSWNLAWLEYGWQGYRGFICSAEEVTLISCTRDAQVKGSHYVGWVVPWRVASRGTPKDNAWWNLCSFELYLLIFNLGWFCLSCPESINGFLWLLPSLFFSPECCYSSQQSEPVEGIRCWLTLGMSSGWHSQGFAVEWCQ
jgi:hypothetical protein